jgi:hypothetical protein
MVDVTLLNDVAGVTGVTVPPAGFNAVHNPTEVSPPDISPTKIVCTPSSSGNPQLEVEKSYVRFPVVSCEVPSEGNLTSNGAPVV